MKNALIKASAGTGKTFALATRMIRLLLLGAEPPQLVALTFSRAAAGEIFNRLASRLAAAASSEPQAEAEAAHVFDGLDPALARALRSRHVAGLTRPVFTALLRQLIASQHLSMIGTIDSFMCRMVQAFPLELGLQGPMTIMDDYTHARQQQAAAAALFGQQAEAPDARLFAEAFRQATFGREGKSFAEQLARFVDAWHTRFQDVPDPEAWGRPARIWPAGAPFAARGAPAALADQLAAQLGPRWAEVGRENLWNEFCAFVRTFNGTFSAAQRAGVKNVLAAWQPGATAVTIAYNRRELTFTGPQARLVLDAVETLYALTVAARCETTQGIHRLMALVEARYAAGTRSRGLLTFGDIPRLIAGLDAAVRQNIEYRFDGRFGHWALDEFQDTSHAQWAAIRNLVDEVIQSDDDAHSIFVVGDSKQAIYGWRGGDVAIFDREAASGHYALADLNTSYRYCPQIAALVNAVFDGPALAARLGPQQPEAARRWRDNWAPHASRQPDGYVAVARMPAPDKEADESALDPYLRAAGDHLRALRPWERGLTAAILVRSNDQGQRFAEGLRAAGVPVVWEGESAICDTPVVTAFLHLLHVAEHPDDTLAWQHLCATPLARGPFRDACGLPPPLGPARLSRQLLDDVARLGLDRTLRRLIDGLAPDTLDAFTRARLDDLVRAATRFAAEADAETRLSDFTGFVETFLTRDIADPSTVKILTIHRSKGLGFDVVIVPVVESTGIDAARADDALVAPDGEWLLSDPGTRVAEADPTLKAARDRAASQRVFEALCVQYVALTRAKRALLLLLKPAAKTPSETLYFSDLVEAALDAPLPWSAGDPLWYQRLPPPAPPASAPAPPPHVRERRRMLRRVTPSESAFHGAPASALFARRDRRAAERGTRLHEALSRIAWLSEPATQPADLPRDELDLTVPSAFRDALTRPPDVIDLWRERAFERIAGDEWVSGTFDRVVFTERDGARQAEIIDFKSNRRLDGESEAAFALRLTELYRGQMASYRAALCHLAGLPPEAVRCRLLLTATRQAVDVPL